MIAKKNYARNFFLFSMNISKVNKAIKKLEEMDYHSHSFASKSLCRKIYGTAVEGEREYNKVMSVRSRKNGALSGAIKISFLPIFYQLFTVMLCHRTDFIFFAKTPSGSKFLEKKVQIY
jgi:hypothetical protein